MAIAIQRNLGMLLLAIWLILYGVAGLTTVALPGRSWLAWRLSLAC